MIPPAFAIQMCRSQSRRNYIKAPRKQSAPSEASLTRPLWPLFLRDSRTDRSECSAVTAYLAGSSPMRFLLSSLRSLRRARSAACFRREPGCRRGQLACGPTRPPASWAPSGPRRRRTRGPSATSASTSAPTAANAWRARRPTASGARLPSEPVRPPAAVGMNYRRPCRNLKHKRLARRWGYFCCR